MVAVALLVRAPLDMHVWLGFEPAGVLAATALIPAALVLVQKELGRAVGLITVSVQSVVFLGLLDTDPLGHMGGILMWGSTGIALVGLGLVTAALRSRLGTVRIDQYSGLLDQAPTFAFLFILFGLAAVGAPGLAVFAGEDLVLHGTIAHQPFLLVVFISAVSLQGYGVLHLFFRVFLGPAAAQTPVVDAQRERAPLLVMVGLLVAVGVMPQPLIDGWLSGPQSKSTLRQQTTSRSEMSAVPAGEHAHPTSRVALEGSDVGQGVAGEKQTPGAASPGAEQLPE